MLRNAWRADARRRGPGQMLKIEMGIDLGRRNAGMAQHFLHRPQVSDDCRTCEAKEWRSIWGWTWRGQTGVYRLPFEPLLDHLGWIRRPRGPRKGMLPIIGQRRTNGGQAESACRALAPLERYGSFRVSGNLISPSRTAESEASTSG